MRMSSVNSHVPLTGIIRAPTSPTSYGQCMARVEIHYRGSEMPILNAANVSPAAKL